MCRGQACKQSKGKDEVFHGKWIKICQSPCLRDISPDTGCGPPNSIEGKAVCTSLAVCCVGMATVGFLRGTDRCGRLDLPSGSAIFLPNITILINLSLGLLYFQITEWEKAGALTYKNILKMISFFNVTI